MLFVLISCFRWTSTASSSLSLFAFRGHAQHPTAHVWLGTLHLYAAVKSLPWQQATSGPNLHWRPVWESRHTGADPKLQSHGFSWTDNWVFSGTFKDLFLFHESFITACLCIGSPFEYSSNYCVFLRWTEWPVCTIFTCARAAFATPGPVRPSSGSPISRWRETCRYEIKG